MKIPKLYFATLFSIKNSYYYSITKNINGIIQINGSYSALHYDKNDDPLRLRHKGTQKNKILLSQEGSY